MAFKIKIGHWVEYEYKGEKVQGKVTHVDDRKHIATIRHGKLKCTVSTKRLTPVVPPALSTQLKFGDSMQVSTLKHSEDVLGYLERKKKKAQRDASVAEVERAQLSFDFGRKI